ncbi:MAG TPA: HPr family phosphocarrier protein [Acidimicrobiia bacterium]|nr:HPr family phosphocarrier protein [Acidimicrobiia bacterium]
MTGTISAEREVEITAPLGLHARPAAEFAGTAARFHSALTVTKNGCEVDATSVLLLLTLDARCGDRLLIRGTGDDAPRAVDRLATLLTGP